jgi:acyl-homoserine lactone acylase PvdQ
VIYAQAEDDFNRVETNYLNSMGRLAEAEGEREIYRDLRMKIFIDPAGMKAKKMYGTTGNSFVAVVEFGDRVKAKAITSGGQSADPASPHFNDQAKRYSTGDLREVYFYRPQLQGHTERTYHPGQ